MKKYKISTEEEKKIKELTYYSIVPFLESIETLEHLEAVFDFIADKKNQCNEEVVKASLKLREYYINGILDDPEPKLSSWFTAKFPLISKKLDNIAKIRTFNRGIRVCNDFPDDTYEIIEYILERHEIHGDNYVKVKSSEDDEQRSPEQLAYFTQIQYSSLQKIMFPGLKKSGCGEYCFWEW